VLPSRKVTVPVAADGYVVAVRVMLDPTVGAVFEALIEVVVVAAWVVPVMFRLLIWKP
jgi:hypothetical protein